MKESLVNYCSRYISLVFYNNVLDHFPIALQVDAYPLDSNRPFKFDHSWLKNDDFFQMIRDFWLSVTCLGDSECNGSLNF